MAFFEPERRFYLRHRIEAAACWVTLLVHPLVAVERDLGAYDALFCSC